MQYYFVAALLCLSAPLIDARSQGYPESCSCKETGVTASECSLFSCDCNCDITVGQCDYHCCCDPDCTAEQVDRFESSTLGCEDYAANKVGVHECYSRSELKKVNPAAPMRGRSTAEDAVDELLCVVKENHNFKGEFYETADVQSSQVFTTSKGSKDHSYDQTADSSGATASTVDAFYDRGDFIPGFFSDGSTAVQLPGGYLAVPQADFSGICNDNYYAEFEEDVSLSACSRSWPDTLSAFTVQCESGDAAVSTFAADIYVLSRPTASLSVQSNHVNITIGQVVYVDPADGSATDVTKAWLANDCSSAVDHSNSNCRFSSTASAANTCHNAVSSLRYLVLHGKDAHSTITGLSAQLVVSDVLFSDVGGTAQKQEFGISFFDESNSFDGAKTGSPPNRTSSGNPGYLYGLPVLHGIVNTSATSLNQIAAGLTIQSPDMTGKCPTGVAGSSSMTVDFGYDTSSACLLAVNRSEFRNLCCEGTSSCAGESEFTDSSGVPYFLIPREGYVGIYGNADPADLDQWLPLTAANPGATRSWTESTGTCNGLITGVNYQFLVAYTGERKNPQNKIISVGVSYTRQDISLRTNPKDASSKQTLPFTVTTSFIFKDDQSLKGYNPPRPPVLFSVPYDIFYPFDIDSSPAVGLNSQLGWVTALVTTVCTMLVGLVPYSY